VTVSNHPVYSDPYYGAGAVSQGTTYNTGTVTYPPGTTYTQANSYAAPAYRTTTIPERYSRNGYTQASYSQSRRSYRPKRAVYGRRHLHGKYECNSYH